jgi:hypothetical protein
MPQLVAKTPLAHAPQVQSAAVAFAVEPPEDGGRRLVRLVEVVGEQVLGLGIAQKRAQIRRLYGLRLIALTHAAIAIESGPRADRGTLPYHDAEGRADLDRSTHVNAQCTLFVAAGQCASTACPGSTPAISG